MGQEPLSIARVAVNPYVTRGLCLAVDFVAFPYLFSILLCRTRADSSFLSLSLRSGASQFLLKPAYVFPRS